VGVFVLENSIFLKESSTIIKFENMATNGEIISRVSNGLRALTKDSYISGKYIINIARTKAKFLMAQKYDDMSLGKEDGIIKTIPCFRLKRIKSKDCGIVEFRVCDKIMKSCEKVPEVLSGRTGPGIFSVLSIDGGVKYRYITPRMYSDFKRRKYKKSGHGYFYLKDDYLYLVDSLNELVDLELILIDQDEADVVSECTESGDIESGCKSKLDSNFVCPDKLLESVVQDTIGEIANFYRTSVPDENPNLDEHQKTKTVQ
jgi:hypothetical protein